MPDVSEAEPPILAARSVESLSLAWRAIYFAQYVSVRMVAALLLGFPDWLLRGVIRIGARAFYRFDKRHRLIAEENLSKSGWSARRAKIMGRRVFEHFTTSFFESMILRRRINSKTWPRYVRCENEPLAREALLKNRGALLIGAHQGNWELAGVVTTLLGYPLVSMARPFKNPYLDGYLNGSLRSATGQQIVRQRGGIREMMRALREKKVGVMLADQNAGRDGVFVDFFGRPASTWSTPALLSLRTGAPILPFYTYREGPYRYVFGVHPDPAPAPTGKLDDDVRALTVWYTGLIERSVRAHPDQWLWSHRRWRSQPGHSRAERAARAAKEHEESVEGKSARS